MIICNYCNYNDYDDYDDYDGWLWLWWIIISNYCDYYDYLWVSSMVNKGGKGIILWAWKNEK